MIFSTSILCVPRVCKSQRLHEIEEGKNDSKQDQNCQNVVYVNDGRPRGSSSPATTREGMAPEEGRLKRRQETSHCRLCSCLALALSVQALPPGFPALLLPGPRRRGGSSNNAKKEVPVSIPALFLMRSENLLCQCQRSASPPTIARC